jgi:hypothetical protein
MSLVLDKKYLNERITLIVISKYVLSNPPFLWVAVSNLEAGPPLNKGGSPFIKVDEN